MQGVFAVPQPHSCIKVFRRGLQMVKRRILLRLRSGYQGSVKGTSTVPKGPPALYRKATQVLYRGEMAQGLYGNAEGRPKGRSRRLAAQGSTEKGIALRR